MSMLLTADNVDNVQYHHGSRFRMIEDTKVYPMHR